MNRELKDKWLMALRGGAFEQMTGGLRGRQLGRQRHCCLNVLLCVSGKYYAPQLSTEGSDDDYELIDALLGGAQLRRDLVELNDAHRKSFSQIADYIDVNL